MKSSGVADVGAMDELEDVARFASRTLCGTVTMFRCPICGLLTEQSWVCECGQVILHFDDTEVYVAEAVANQFIEERKNNRKAEAKARDENKLQKPKEEKHSQWKCDHCNKSLRCCGASANTCRRDMEQRRSGRMRRNAKQCKLYNVMIGHMRMARLLNLIVPRKC